MTPRVDHDQRRFALAEAVWRVVLTDGVAGLSVRRVGAEAGWTSGAVQYYFPSRNDLLSYAFEQVQNRTLARIADDCAAVADADAANAAVHSILPISDDQRAEAEVWFGFLGMALGNPQMRVVGQRGHNIVLNTITAQVRRSQQAGTIAMDLDPASVAMELIVLVDGLCVQALYRDAALGNDQIEDVVSRRLDGFRPCALVESSSTV